jgi:hypothetical protein
MTPKEKDLFLFLFNESLKDGASLHFKLKDKLVSGKVNVSGDFREFPREIRVGVDPKKTFRWLSVLAHEYCHNLQARKHKPYWEKSNKRISPTYGDSYSTFFYWLENDAKLSGDVVWESMINARNMELECEKMTASLLKRFGFKTNVYIRSANAYVFFYTFAFHYKKWWKIAPYQVVDLVGEMPSKFLLPKEYNKLPRKYEDLMKGHCI